LPLQKKYCSIGHVENSPPVAGGWWVKFVKLFALQSR
jgi:hypothetical protein